MGSGIIYLTISRIFLALSSFVIHIAIARFAGIEQYGLYGVLMSFLNITYMTYQPGLHSAVTKYTAESPASAKPILNTALKAQAILAGVVTIAAIIFSPFIAGLLKDKTLTPFLALTALIIIPTSLNGIYQASLNGVRKFGRVSISIGFQGGIKMLFVISAIYLGYNINGIIIAIIIATIIELFFTKSLCNYPESSEKFELKKIVSFASAVILYVFFLTAITSVDLLFVKSIIGSNVDTGLYTAAVNIAKVPVILFVSFPTVVLPSISKAVFENDINKIKQYFNESVRYMLIFLIPIAVIMSASAKGIVELLYTDKYTDAYLPLMLLSFGLAFSSLLSLLSAIIVGSGNPKVSMYIVLSLFPLDLLLNYLFIHSFGIAGAALATSTIFFIGIVLMLAYIYRKFHITLYVSSLLKSVFTGIFLFFISSFISLRGFYLFIEVPMLFGLYFLILIVVKEIDIEDFKKIKSIVTLKKI